MSNDNNNSKNKPEKTVYIKLGRETPTPSNTLKPKLVIKPKDKK